MGEDSAFHFPPDLFEAIIAAVPLLVKGKRAVLSLFAGCGVSGSYLLTLEEWVRPDSGVSKQQIAREVVTHLNQLGDRGLAARRQLIKRLSEWEDFSGSWPDDRLKAQGAVAGVQKLVNQKDSFTRLQAERERELAAHRATHQREIARRAALERERSEIKSALYALFGETNPQRRGKALEAVLNRLFKAHDILVSEAFVLTCDTGVATEQIDGVVEIDGRVYLVEMKWWNQPLGRAEVAPHLVSVYHRAEVGGILISYSGFHQSAIEECERALTQRSVILVELQEIVLLIDQGGSLLEMLRAKLKEAALQRRPLTYPLGRVQSGSHQGGHDEPF